MKTVMRWIAIPALVLCLWSGTPVRGQSQPSIDPGTVAQPAVAGDTTATEENEDNAEKLYDLKFSSAPLDQILRFYSDLTRRTLIESPANSKVTITLRSQTKLNRDETLMAIKSILAMNGIGLVTLGEKFVKVVPVANVQQEGLSINSENAARSEADDVISEIITLKNIEAADAQKAIQGLVHPYGKITIIERINSLLVADTMLNIMRMREILDQIDQPLEIKEELHIVPILHAKPSDIKSKLTEIIQETKGQQKSLQATVARPSPSGPPGVIRARTTTVSTTPSSVTVDDAEGAAGKVIRGEVRMVADDRTSILIIITRPENMRFFSDVIKALDIATEPDVVVKVHRLEYADAAKVAGMLNTLIGAAAPKDAPKSATAKTGEGIDSGKTTTPGGTALENYLRQREAATAAQQRESSATASEGLSASSKSKVGELSAESIKILPDERINGLIIMASKRDMATIMDILKDMDVMLSQVLIEAVIVQVGLTKKSERGVDWLQRSMIAYSKTPSGKNDPLFAYAGGGGSGNTVPIDATTPINGSMTGAGLTYYFTHFGLNIDAVVKLTASDSNAKILSSPIIIAQDNDKDATIEVTEERYFYKGVRAYGDTSLSGQNYAPDVESRKVGLSLVVSPRINAKGFVVMKIKQKIESLGAPQTIQMGVGQPAQEWPTVNSRELTASVAVQNRETIVMGGLMENRSSDNVNKIPFLGDIPVLGIPFRNLSREKTRAEILVFITPYVLGTPAEIQAEAVRRKTALGENGKWDKGWSDSKLGDDLPASKSDKKSVKPFKGNEATKDATPTPATSKPISSVVTSESNLLSSVEADAGKSTARK